MKLQNDDLLRIMDFLVRCASGIGYAVGVFFFILALFFASPIIVALLAIWHHVEIRQWWDRNVYGPISKRLNSKLRPTTSPQQPGVASAPEPLTRDQH